MNYLKNFNSYLQEDLLGENIKERRFRAPLIILTSIILLVLVLLFVLVYMQDIEKYGQDITIISTAFVFLVFILVLVYFNQLKIAGGLFIFIWIGVATFLGWRYQHPDDDPVAIGLYVFSILLAGLYLNRAGTYIIVALNSFLVFVLYYAAELGVRGAPPESIDNPIIFTVLFFATAYIYEFTYGQLNNFSQQTEVQNAELLTRNTELQAIQNTLEETISARTDALERRARLVEAAADVGRAATSIYNMDELLPQVTQFIAERFEYYHVGIFLLDELNEFAVLRAANSDGGRRLIARGLKLRVGEEGIIGYVTSSGEARIVADIQEDDFYMDAPELPETKSEIGLPLFAGGRLFGALDVQSTNPFAFAEEDIGTLRVLADQVSMAINNATLFEQLQNSLESERLAYGVVSKQAWQSILSSQDNLGYQYKNNKTTPVAGTWSPTMMNAAANQKTIISNEDGRHTLAVPIVSGNEIIGIMHLKKDISQKDWGVDEISLVEDLSSRISQALDSARLFQETQRQATYQQLSSEVSSAMRESLEIDTVLRTAAQELGEAFNAKEVVIRLNTQKS